MLDIAKPSPATAALRPSEYTATLIHVLRHRSECVKDAKVLEMGCGSGVVLAALGAMGAGSLSGIDIEDEAVRSGRSLLRELGHDAQLFHGDMWQPVAGCRFDLIVANLPHFPMEHIEVAGRLPTWSSGGSDGREFLDPFIEGLADHFTAKARAVLTHNAFVDVERSRTLAARRGLALTILASVLVHIPNEKLALMTPSVLLMEEGKSIHRYGPHVFADLHIVEISPVGTQS